MTNTLNLSRLLCRLLRGRGYKTTDELRAEEKLILDISQTIKPIFFLHLLKVIIIMARDVEATLPWPIVLISMPLLNGKLPRPFLQNRPPSVLAMTSGIVFKNQTSLDVHSLSIF